MCFGLKVLLSSFAAFLAASALPVVYQLLRPCLSEELHGPAQWPFCTVGTLLALGGLGGLFSLLVNLIEFNASWWKENV